MLLSVAIAPAQVDRIDALSYLALISVPLGSVYCFGVLV
jgi:hypothetical protein